MTAKTSDSLKFANDLENKFGGKLFLGGNTPSAEDVAAFNKLIGGAENVNLARWLKNMASFTPTERASWTAPVVITAPTVSK